MDEYLKIHLLIKKVLKSFVKVGGSDKDYDNFYVSATGRTTKSTLENHKKAPDNSNIKK